jgi:hypothetical protein
MIESRKEQGRPETAVNQHIDRVRVLFEPLLAHQRILRQIIELKLSNWLTFALLDLRDPQTAFATSILAVVQIAAHRLNVSEGGKPTYSWGIATARRGYHTPRGTYHVTALNIDAYSGKYDAPMPYAVCFIRG